MTLAQVLTSWSFDAVPTVGVLLAGLSYGLAWRRLPPRRDGGRRLSPVRPVCFYGGLLALVIAVDGPPDALAESAFSIHMVQHQLLQMVAAPLLLLGGPIVLLLRVDPPWFRRRLLVRVLRSRVVGVLTHPVTALAAFTLVLYATHLSGFYELALRHEPVHQAEHAAYLVTALLFWWPAVGVDPAPHRIDHLWRVLYLMVSMPVPAFLGLAIANAGHVLYPSYAGLTPWGATGLADQQAAGTLMWVAGMFTTVPALAVVVMRWLDDDSRRDVRRGPAAARSPHGLASAR